MAIATINVTQDIIDGNLSDVAVNELRVQTCPMYQAATAALPNVHRVSADTIHLDDGQQIPLPRIAQIFILRADVQMRVKEGTLPFDPLDIDMEPLKPLSFQVSYQS